MNKLKEHFKKNKIFLLLYKKILDIVFVLLTYISPDLNTKFRYKLVFKKKYPENDPKTLNEKILWLKLNNYISNPLVIKCADKYLVREYVESCGCGEILNELHGVYNSVDEIIWSELPDQFVLKWNFGAGRNIICTDKSKMDENVVLRQMNKWGKEKSWLKYSEMHYKYIPKKIICESLICVNKEK